MKNMYQLVKRKVEIGECRNLITDESVDHLHIRRKAIVTGFAADLKEEIEDDCRVISVDVLEWDPGELMETLRWELQKEKSTPAYLVSKLRALGATISVFGSGVGGDIEFEKGPDYSRVREYLQDVAKQSDKDFVIFINHHGDKPVDGFGWISKLGELPDNTTIVTDGFQRCTQESSEEYEIGRLSEDQTVDFLTSEREDIKEEDAKWIHKIHDGNPVAIEIALEKGNIEEPLCGDELDELWERVYDDKITAEQYDLLSGSAHLIDLDSRDVAMAVDKSRGECREILGQLEKQGVVSKKNTRLFTADKYVTRYISRDLGSVDISESHRESFQFYVEKWAEDYVARMQELEKIDPEEAADGQFFSDGVDYGYTDTNLYLAIHHLSESHGELGVDTFVEELEEIVEEYEVNRSGVFAFGIIAQRFFFENPKEVIGEMSEAILGIDEELDNEIFSSTFDILFNFNLKQYTIELSKGWSGEINSENLQSTNMADPDEVVKQLQQGISHEYFVGFPPEVKLALSRLAVIPWTDTRKAREYYNKFGKTAEKFGLQEEAFCGFSKEFGKLVELLSPDEDTGNQNGKDRIEDSFESLDTAIRDRIELQDRLKENRSKAQQEFQSKLERIRDKPNEIVDQYVECGEELSLASNRLFPYLWYAIGDNVFAKAILGHKSGTIHGQHMYWKAKREDQEEALDSDVLVISIEEIESAFD